MKDSPTVAAARRFLKLMQEGERPSDRELARALDELAMAFHDAPEGKPAEGDIEPPTRAHERYKHWYAMLGKRFPEYGYYALSDPTEPVTEESLVGDAIDDLADIIGDLEEVVWRFENLGADDAHWHLKLLYQIHWGMHLRQLSHYLHAKLW